MTAMRIKLSGTTVPTVTATKWSFGSIVELAFSAVECVTISLVIDVTVFVMIEGVGVVDLESSISITPVMAPTEFVSARIFVAEFE
jgi:hypothetical protein